MAQAEAGEFNLIVAEVDSGRVADASREFARAFGLDEQIAGQICKTAPIIFAQKLTKSEVKAITPKLTELSKLGIEFRVTARLAGKIPKVNWPVRPQFTAGNSGGPNGLAFEWDNNAFVCPGCGETFLFRRLGKLKLSDGAAGPETKTLRAPAAAPAGASAEALGFADEPRSAPTVEGVEGLQPVAGEGESLDLPDAGEQITLDAAALEAAPEADAGAAPAVEKGEFSTATEELAPEAEAAAPETEAEEAPSEEAAPAEGGELYNVFLSKITDASKRDKAAELISKVKKCSINEAKELTSRLVIPLAKNVSKEKAEDILNQFKKLKIFGRMTKVK